MRVLRGSVVLKSLSKLFVRKKCNDNYIIIIIMIVNYEQNKTGNIFSNCIDVVWDGECKRLG